MGRKKTNKVYRYFEIDRIGNTSTCLVDNCGKVLKTQHGANLMKHLQYIHPDLHKTVSELNNSDLQINTVSVNDQVIEECTNLVAVHGRPFALINDTAFQNLLKMIPNNSIAVNAKKIRDNVESMATKARFEMSKEFVGRTLCLKVDVASLATRCFLGINCQYLHEGRIILKNLAVTEIFQRHTSDHLKDLVLINLQRFRIDKKQIYTITTDNGANMIKMTKLISEAQEADVADSSSSNLFIEDADSDFDSDSANVSDEIYTSRILEGLASQFQNNTVSPDFDVQNEYPIGVVRCAAHTLQLAAQDASNNAITRNLLSECREVVRRLRTPRFVRIIKEQKEKIPKLDCPTRWHSAIDMVESLLILKDLCIQNNMHLPLIISWNDLEDFVKTLIPVKILTKKLQEEHLTVGDFYIEWMLCQYKLAKIDTDLARNITNQIIEREKMLLESDSFINAIFLDPRVNSILTIEQQIKAKENLTKLFLIHFKFHNNQIDRENNLAATVDNAGEVSENLEARTELEDFLNLKYIDKHNDLNVLLRRIDPSGEIINNLQQSFNLYFQEPLLKSSENVLLYWEKNKLKFPYLYKLSQIVLATPMTQVSVERLFSSLKFVVNYYRRSMTDAIIDDLLFLRSNNIFGK